MNNDAFNGNTPKIIRNIKWFVDHGRKQWKYVLLAILIIICGFVFTNFDLTVGTIKGWLPDTIDKIINRD